MLRLLVIALVFASTAFGAENETQKISYKLSSVKIEKSMARNGMNFSKIQVEGFEMDKTLGAPELPVESLLLQGTPESIQVLVKTEKEEVLENVRPYPVQEQDCRCEVKVKPKFQYQSRLYRTEQSPYKLTYLGAFRGTPITRLDIHLAAYDSAKNKVIFKTETEFSHNSEVFSFTAGDYKDYLIVVPSDLKEGVKSFADWKTSRGYNVHIEAVKAPVSDLVGLSKTIRKYYDEMGVDFVIIVGDEKMVPMYKVRTSGSGQTPTDLKHFTMDGTGDFVPDVFASRIVASNASQVAAQLQKSIEFEQKNFKDMSGFKRIIGIASNEGSGPSDDQYIRSIEERFESVLGATATHLHQNDSQNSNPTVLNQNFNQGAFWLTYMGHGSGTDWPSLNRNYSVSHIKQMNNQPAVKPILIDVACMNGLINTAYLGSSFMKTESLANNMNPFGATAYFGGTVNISWHPPAVMARGIAYEHLEKKFKHLGEALLAGQLYLAANWNNQEQVIDNFEWYHLQGDPGMNIEF